MGGKAPSVPAPSSTELALQSSQKELLDLQAAAIRRSQKETELLSPILYEQLGIAPQYNDKGELTGYSRTATGQQMQDIQSAYLRRTQAALEGNLPVNAALTRDLGDQERMLKERLFRQLGPGWETSSPGIEALSKFEESKNIALDAARRGDLTTAEQLGMARGGYTFGQLVGSPDRYLAGGSAAGNAAAGYGSAAGLLQSNRLADYQGAVNAYNSRNTSFGQLFGGLGQLGGMALGTYLGSPAGRRLFA